MPANGPDLAPLHNPLEALFQAYPAGNHCDICARAVGILLREAGFEVAIVTIQNEMNPGLSLRPPYIQAKLPDGKLFLLGQNGFHQATRITLQGTFYYIDSLVYLHYGVVAINGKDFFDLFMYADGVEVTDVEVM